MCLQWCHVHSWLIDNDLPCVGCSHGEHTQLAAAWSCVTCRHHIVHGAQTAICGLTRETLPLTERCCHWNVVVETVSVLHLSDAHLAPWLPGIVTEVFEASETAPQISFTDAGQITVQLDELSVPLVYGVPAADWDQTLGWQERGTPEAPALDDTWRLAIEELISTLEGDAGALRAALEQIALVYASTAPSADVSDILTPLFDMVRMHYNADTSLKTVLEKLERSF